MPRTPATTLNDLLPWLGGVLSVPISALIGVAMIGIPLLAIAALTQRWTLRALMSAVLLGLLLALAWSTSSGTVDINPVRVALALVALGSLSVPLVLWGGLAAWSWVVAAIAFQGFGGVRTAAYGAVWQDRATGALILVGALAAVALIARRTGPPRSSENALTQI